MTATETALAQEPVVLTTGRDLDNPLAKKGAGLGRSIRPVWGESLALSELAFAAQLLIGAFVADLIITLLFSIPLHRLRIH